MPNSRFLFVISGIRSSSIALLKKMPIRRIRSIISIGISVIFSAISKRVWILWLCANITLAYSRDFNSHILIFDKLLK